MTGVNQKEYLKKYLSIGSEPGKKKKHKKKPSAISDRVKIIDDDVDIATFNQAVEEDLHGLNEDAPQIVGIIDDRPLELRIDDYRKSDLWKPLGPENDIAVIRSNIGQASAQEGASTKAQKLSKKGSRSDDYSPPRKRGNNSDDDDDYSPPRKGNNNSANTDYSPPRKRTNYSNSPPRKKGNYGDDNSPPRKRNRYDDKTPPRASKTHTKDGSPDRRRRRDSDKSPARKTKPEDSQVRKYRRSSDDSPRRKTYDEGARRNMTRSNERPYYRRDDTRRNSRDYDRYKSNKRTPDKYNDTYRKGRRYNDNSPPRSYKGGRNTSPNRYEGRDYSRGSRNEKKEETSGTSSRQRKSRWDDEQEKKSPLDDLIPKLLMKRKSGLERANQLMRENKFFNQTEEEVSATNTAEEPEGNVTAILRDRQTGKIRDLKAEAEEAQKKQEHEDETKAKYDRWGRGLKQVEDATERLNTDLHEMSKPLARYADDEDLEKHLKEVERDGDPMLAYLKKKKRKKDVEAGKPMKPQFEGEFMPNRYGIKPGHRWDGVDRSNGYEKQWFEAMNSRRAQLEDAYKWSTEDM